MTGYYEFQDKIYWVTGPFKIAFLGRGRLPELLEQYTLMYLVEGDGTKFLVCEDDFLKSELVGECEPIIKPRFRKVNNAKSHLNFSS